MPLSALGMKGYQPTTTQTTRNINSNFIGISKISLVRLVGTEEVALSPQVPGLVEVLLYCPPLTETVGLLGTGAQDGHLDSLSPQI